MKKGISILFTAIAAACLVFFAVAPHHHHDDGRICINAGYVCNHDHDHGSPKGEQSDPHSADCSDHVGSCVSNLDYIDPQTDGGGLCKLCSCGNPDHLHPNIILIFPTGEETPPPLSDDLPGARRGNGYLLPGYASGVGRLNGLRAPPLC